MAAHKDDKDHAKTARDADHHTAPRREPEHEGKQSKAQASGHAHVQERPKTEHKPDHKDEHRPARQDDKQHTEGATKQEEQFLKEHADELSKSTLRAKWINSPDEHGDRAGQTLATRNHDVIQHWAEERKAVPATIQANDPHDPHVLRFNFPGYGGQKLQEISWDEWFKPFDQRQLVFLFQDRKSDGSQSNFFHFDNPDREHD